MSILYAQIYGRTVAKCVTMFVVFLEDVTGVTRVPEEAHSWSSSADNYITISFSAGCCP